MIGTRILGKRNIGRFKEGDRVKLAVPGFFMGYQASLGDIGTVVKVHGSIYPDPLHHLVFVRWEKGGTEGVYRENLIKAR